MGGESTRQPAMDVDACRGGFPDVGSIPTASTISMTALRGLDQFQDLQGGFGFKIARRPRRSEGAQ